MENKSGDRRVRKTKNVLRAGLVKLMRQKNVQEITVKELCEECDLNRGTFYAHFTDVFALLHSIEEEMLAQLQGVLYEYSLLDVKGTGQPSPVMKKIFRFLADNADMGRLLICDNGDMAFVEKVKLAVREKFMSEWEQRTSLVGSDESDYLYAFIVSGCIGVLQQWLARGMPQTPEQMAGMVEQLLVRGVSNANSNTVGNNAHNNTSSNTPVFTEKEVRI